MHFSLPTIRERRACDIRTVRQSPGQSHRVHLRVSQYATAVGHNRPGRDGPDQTAFRHGHVSGARTTRQGIQRSDRFPRLDENRDRLRRRGR